MCVLSCGWDLSLSYVICIQSRRHVKKENTKKYKEEKAGCSVFGKTSFPFLFSLGQGLITPYSSGVLIWNFYKTLLIVCIELWLRFEPQICSTRFATNFLFVIVATENKVRFCLKMFDHFLTEYSSVAVFHPKLCWDFSIRFEQEIIFWKCSRNVLHSKALLFPDLWNFAIVSAIFYEFILRWKVSKTLTHVLSYLRCIQSRRHVQKENTEKDISKKKASRCVMSDASL